MYWKHRWRFGYDKALMNARRVYIRSRYASGIHPILFPT